MTRPRLYPDRPRTCAETRAWAVAAKAAGAHIWQIAVFTQRQPNTLYKVLQRHARLEVSHGRGLICSPSWGTSTGSSTFSRR